MTGIYRIAVATVPCTCRDLNLSLSYIGQSQQLFDKYQSRIDC